MNYHCSCGSVRWDGMKEMKLGGECTCGRVCEGIYPVTGKYLMIRLYPHNEILAFVVGRGWACASHIAEHFEMKYDEALKKLLDLASSGDLERYDKGRRFRAKALK